MIHVANEDGIKKNLLFARHAMLAQNIRKVLTMSFLSFFFLVMHFILSYFVMHFSFFWLCILFCHILLCEKKVLSYFVLLQLLHEGKT